MHARGFLSAAGISKFPSPSLSVMPYSFEAYCPPYRPLMIYLPQYTPRLSPFIAYENTLHDASREYAIRRGRLSSPGSRRPEYFCFAMRMPTNGSMSDISWIGWFDSADMTIDDILTTGLFNYLVTSLIFAGERLPRGRLGYLFMPGLLCSGMAISRFASRMTRHSRQSNNELMICKYRKFAISAAKCTDVKPHLNARRRLRKAATH